MDVNFFPSLYKEEKKKKEELVYLPLYEEQYIPAPEPKQEKENGSDIIIIELI